MACEASVPVQFLPKWLSISTDVAGTVALALLWHQSPRGFPQMSMHLATVHMLTRPTDLHPCHLCYPAHCVVPFDLELPPALFTMLFSSKSPQSSERAKVPPPRRRSTTISMMEEEFGIREPPQAVTRFGGNSKYPVSPLLFSY